MSTDWIDPTALDAFPNNILSRLKALEEKVNKASRANTTANQLSEIATDLGVQVAGMFVAASGTVTDPTDSAFSGTFMSGDLVTTADSKQSRIAEVLSGVAQFYVGNGAAYAGGGVVVLNADGIDIITSTVAADLNAYTFHNSGGSKQGGVYASDDGSTNYLALISNPDANRESHANLRAVSPAGYASEAKLTAHVTGQTTYELILRQDSSGNTSWDIPAGVATTTGGTSFPASPTTRMVYFRTDLGMQCYYDGTRWLTVQEYPQSIRGAASYSTANTSDILRLRTDYSKYFTRVSVTTIVQTTNNGSNYWTVTVRGEDLGLANQSTILSFNTSADSAGTYTDHAAAASTAIPTNQTHIDFAVAKTGSPGNISVYTTAYYRLIVT